jgi:hypothetical protein
MQRLTFLLIGSCRLVNVTESGALKEARLTDMATRALTAWYALGQDQGYPATNFDQSSLDTNSKWGTFRPASSSFTLS